MTPPHPGKSALDTEGLPADHPYRDWNNAGAAVEDAIEKLGDLADSIAARWNQQKRG